MSISVTWVLVLFENVLLALIPLFLGLTIDDLMLQQMDALWQLTGIMFLLVVVAVLRRFYDTRAYGLIRVKLGTEVARRASSMPVSKVNARLDMCREMVDFLEQEVPELLTAVVQLLVSIFVLWSFDHKLGLATLAALLLMIALYAMFHTTFFKLNGALNSQKECQVAVLESSRRKSVLVHLMKLRRAEIKLSDTEAILYGFIFTAMFGMIIFNLVQGASIPGITAGAIFAIMNYSWAFVESSIALPMALQQWTRLSEIRHRLNAHNGSKLS